MPDCYPFNGYLTAQLIVFVCIAVGVTYLCYIITLFLPTPISEHAFVLHVPRRFPPGKRLETEARGSLDSSLLLDVTKRLTVSRLVTLRRRDESRLPRALLCHTGTGQSLARGSLVRDYPEPPDLNTQASTWLNHQPLYECVLVYQWLCSVSQVMGSSFDCLPLKTLPIRSFSVCSET